MLLTLLLTVFRMIVLPVEFQDRQFTAGREEQQAMVRQAQDYFNRQYGDPEAFSFELAPAVRLSHSLSYYGANYSDRKDIRIQEAVREACNSLKDEIDFPAYDNDGDGAVDVVFLLTAGPGEQEGGDENALWPQQGWLSANGGSLTLKGKRIDAFAASPEGVPGIFCHEFAHILGLPDFYDTDGAGSGGQTPGLWGTSLMDEGCRQAVLPDFGAAEFEILGLGTCDPLATGHYELAPLPEGRRYLKATTDKEGECFLFGCGPGGLYVYHLDRSENPAGYSPHHDAVVSARQRWDSGTVNDAPEHPCLRLLPADPEAEGARLPFPQPDFDSFGSDTPSPFRSWSGRASGLALTGIQLLPDGSVSFDVVEPLRLTDISVYQDAAVVRWQQASALGEVLGYELRWSDGTESFSRELGADARSCTLEGLKPQTNYSFSVLVRTSEHDRYSVGGHFVTKLYREGTYPYIYLSNVPRGTDGSFPPDSKIPLRVFNATDVLEVRWTLNGATIEPGADGYYTLTRSGTLKAEILHTDGTSEVIIKQINVL